MQIKREEKRKKKKKKHKNNALVADKNKNIYGFEELNFRKLF